MHRIRPPESPGPSLLGRGRAAITALAVAILAAACGGTFNWAAPADSGRAAAEAHDFATYGMAPDWAGYGNQFTAFCSQLFGFDCETTGGRHSLAPDMSSAEAIAAFAAEQDHPRAVLADISIQLGADADARGVAAPYRISNAAHLPADMYGADGGWVATYAATPVFLVDVDALAGRGLAPPASWQAIADPRYRGLVAMGQPVLSGTATDAVISLFVAEGGTLDQPGPALAACRGLRSNLVSPVSLSDPAVLAVARPSKPSPPALAAASASPRPAASVRPTKTPRPSATARPTAGGSSSPAASAAPSSLPTTSPDPFAAAGAPILILLDVRAVQLAVSLGSGRAQVVVPADGGAWAVGGLLLNRYAVDQGDVAKAFAEWSLSPQGQAVIASSGLHPIRNLVSGPDDSPPPSAAPSGTEPAAYAKVKVVNVAAWSAARVGELWDGACAGSG